jgi:hypothetical protein
LALIGAVPRADEDHLPYRGSDWRARDEIPLGRRSLRVVEVRDDADQAPTLGVEDLP